MTTTDIMHTIASMTKNGSPVSIWTIANMTGSLDAAMDVCHTLIERGLIKHHGPAFMRLYLAVPGVNIAKGLRGVAA